MFLKHATRFLSTVLAAVVSPGLNVPLLGAEPTFPSGKLRLLNIVCQHHEEPCNAADSGEPPVGRGPHGEAIVVRSMRMNAGHREFRSILGQQAPCRQ